MRAVPASASMATGTFPVPRQKRQYCEGTPLFSELRVSPPSQTSQLGPSALVMTHALPDRERVPICAAGQTSGSTLGTHAWWASPTVGRRGITLGTRGSHASWGAATLVVAASATDADTSSER